MRIIAGELKGRIFSSPHTNKTHPMSDKARGALFNVLGDIEGMSVLDSFAGSGALGLEALSRGASRATFIDSDRVAAQTMKSNTEALGVSARTKVIHSSVGAWLDTSPDVIFDLVLCDPPYDHLQPALITRLCRATKKDGIFALSWPPATEPLSLEEFTLLEQRNYGDATLVFYRRVG